MDDLRIAIRGGREAFRPRAAWILEELAGAIGMRPRHVDGDADLVYSELPPAHGVWIPAQVDAQDFLLGGPAFPGAAVHRRDGLTLLFPPVAEGRELPGDIVAGAFYLMARIDERRVAARDRFGRLPLAESAFAHIDGLELLDPPVEGYVAALRRALRRPAPSGWHVYLTHDIDRISRRTAKGIGGVLRRGGPVRAARVLIDDPWDNLVDLLWRSGRRGLAPTVFLIGRNAHPLDGTPRRRYERLRRRMAAAVRAAGGEVGLHAAFASAEDPIELIDEMAGLRGDAGDVRGVRYHYLRFRYHETVPWLEQAGAEYDASLGFSEAPGYAAGIARPFRPYLLDEERPARLQLVPLAVMDTTLASHLRLDAAAARGAALAALAPVRAAGGAACLLWHNTYLDDERAPGYGPLWEHLLDDLAGAGAALGPVRPPDPPAAARLDGVRAVHLTSVHRPTDVRIFHKEARALASAGADAGVLGLTRPAARRGRLSAGWRLAAAARRTDADVYHVHDPELLPAAIWLRLRTGRAVVYDAHEYLGETVRTKRWLPGPLRVPLAMAAEWAEARGARALDGLVTVNPDLAARFAMAGARSVSVANGPWGAAFPPPDPPSGAGILYVGGLGPLRGLDLMRAAFPLVDVPGARLVLAGPGDPGALPPRVSAIGAVDHGRVPALLADAAVAWIPLQRHGNYDRAVPTKLVEAMAAGRPVVASELGRMGALVRASGCGLLVPPDDPDAHAAAITRLLTDRDELADRGAAGRRAFEHGLAFEHEAVRLVDFYAGVLEAEGAR